MSSGAKKPGLPTKSVNLAPSVIVAQRPKSQSLTMPSVAPPVAHFSGSPQTRTFSGLRSRWAMPALWQWRRPSARMRMICFT